mgnify:CR=1
MEWSMGQDRMVSSLERLNEPSTDDKKSMKYRCKYYYYVCCIGTFWT